MYYTVIKHSGHLRTLDECRKHSPAARVFYISLVFSNDHRVLCNISKTSASVSSGVPNTEKVMKARGRRPSAFIVSRCLEPLMKHEARVFDMASQMKQ